MSLELEVRRLSQRDMCGGFSAGTEPDEIRLTEFFRQFAKQNEKRQLSATFVALTGGTIAGFVTVAPGSISRDTIGSQVKGLPGYPASVMVLARMATDARFQKRGVGTGLMRQVFLRTIDLADGHGCSGIFVDAKPTAVTFYLKFGFVALQSPGGEGASTPMFLALLAVKQAAKAFAGSAEQAGTP